MGAGDPRAESARVETVGAVNMDAVDAEIEALKKTLQKTDRDGWTERQIKMLLALWPQYHKVQVAKAIGHQEKACRAKYQELTEGK